MYLQISMHGLIHNRALQAFSNVAEQYPIDPRNERRPPSFLAAEQLRRAY